MSKIAWKILTWGLVLCFILARPLVTAFTEGTAASYLIISAYFGLLTYVAFKKGYDKKKSLQYAGILAGILIVIPSIITFFVRKAYNKMMEIVAVQAGPGGAGMISTFSAPPSTLLIVISGIVFFILPLIIYLLEKKEYASDIKRNPWLTLAYIVLTFGIYEIYWLWLMKKSLAKRDVTLPSLWLLLVPFVGYIIFVVKLAKGLEKITNTEFIAWFLLLLLLNGIDVPIVQGMLNKKLSS